MMSLHPRSHPRGGKETDPVNALAVIYVNEHLDMLRSEAAQRRTASQAERRSLRDRLASAASDVRRVLGGDSDDSVLPKLENYPYGG
jgi:hypothetical protein